ncbi:hypothetical protein ZEAMMB73_Zm00001d004824, partial [Zea mays]
MAMLRCMYMCMCMVWGISDVYRMGCLRAASMQIFKLRWRLPRRGLYTLLEVQVDRKRRAGADQSLNRSVLSTKRNNTMVSTDIFLKSTRYPNRKVALGRVLSQDPKTKVGDVALGKEFWMVRVSLVSMRDEQLIRPYNNFKVLRQVGNNPIAWPSSCVSSSLHLTRHYSPHYCIWLKYSNSFCRLKRLTDNMGRIIASGLL